MKILNYKVKNVIKNSFSIIFCIICLIFLIFAPNFVFNSENYALDINRLLKSETKETVVLTMHHIETFEGGTNSRSTFLKNQALKFNKQYNNVYISVITMTPEQLILNLKENNIPDMYSFGTGVGEYISGFLTTLDKINTKSFLKSSGILYNETYVYPYILSGYSLISNENLLKNNKNIDFFDENSENFEKKEYFVNRMESVSVNRKLVSGVSIGRGFTSAVSSIVDLDESQIDATIFDTTYDAYCNFVEGKSVSLIGTARDLARCKNRENNGKLSPCIYTPLSSYSDLVQYVGVVSRGTQYSMSISKIFAKYLTSSSAQKNLSKYGLFSTTIDKIYDSEYMSEFEDAYNKLSFVPSAFITKAEIDDSWSKFREQ